MECAEGVSRADEGDVVVPALPGAAFVVVESEAVCRAKIRRTVCELRIR